MDNTATTTPVAVSTPAPSTGDQELSKMLAELGSKGPAADKPAPTPAPKPENEPKPSIAAPAAIPAPKPVTPPSPFNDDKKEEKKEERKDDFKPTPKQDDKKPAGDLDAIKNSALDELRPLAERINLPPAEKFDTLLLIIRTTDDKDLIKYAHEVARQIEDKDKQAQALLDIVKEVDFFTHK